MRESPREFAREFTRDFRREFRREFARDFRRESMRDCRRESTQDCRRESMRDCRRGFMRVFRVEQKSTSKRFACVCKVNRLLECDLSISESSRRLKGMPGNEKDVSLIPLIKFGEPGA
jgi:hypothetical protein